MRRWTNPSSSTPGRAEGKRITLWQIRGAYGFARLQFLTGEISHYERSFVCEWEIEAVLSGRLKVCHTRILDDSRYFLAIRARRTSSQRILMPSRRVPTNSGPSASPFVRWGANWRRRIQQFPEGKLSRRLPGSLRESAVLSSTRINT